MPRTLTDTATLSPSVHTRLRAFLERQRLLSDTALAERMADADRPGAPRVDRETGRRVIQPSLWVKQCTLDRLRLPFEYTQQGCGRAADLPCSLLPFPIAGKAHTH